MNTLRPMCARAIGILRAEGVAGLARGVKGFIRLLARRVYRRQDAYLYEHNLVPRPRDKFLPRLKSYDLRIVHSNEEADRVVAEGLEDFRAVFVFSR
ncbi:MAG: hypothetical protein IMY84_03090, partial [Chloroflexi bacterium]|nr:hypothetical protein [Chloroflexota bacterium]